MDKKKKDFYLNLLTFVGMPIIAIVGTLMMGFFEYDTLGTLGALLFFIGGFVFMFRLFTFAIGHFTNKNKRDEDKARIEKENMIAEARQTFKSRTDYPEKNTVKLTDAGVEFFAEGRYVCEKDFKDVSGNHFAFEIRSTSLKNMPEDYDDICDLERIGVIIEVGYHDDEALEKYANDNGVILQDTLENSIDRTITLKPDSGYTARVCTAENDDIDYGFVKILGLENDVLTMFFSLTASCGLCDTIEGVVRLKRQDRTSTDIHSLIDRIKWKQFNTIEVKDEEIQQIKRDNPFLPDSYIAFLSEVGFADLNWIDIGWNNNTPTNLDSDQKEYVLDDNQTDDVNDVIKDYTDKNVGDYYFIAIDNDGTYYALSRNADDKKVYILSDDVCKGTYETFEVFVSEILST
ncbi:MAG: SMI1/KNR4 family protein [Clostridiales bacterium]|nr:SMI1/KNR4 family protein [Clostridiales bacterium]